MLHPMLHQSKLQLSLGLAADKPLDLKGWGYGDGSLSSGALSRRATIRSEACTPKEADVCCPRRGDGCGQRSD